MTRQRQISKRIAKRQLDNIYTKIVKTLIADIEWPVNHNIELIPVYSWDSERNYGIDFTWKEDYETIFEVVPGDLPNQQDPNWIITRQTYNLQIKINQTSLTLYINTNLAEPQIAQPQVSTFQLSDPQFFQKTKHSILQILDTLKTRIKNYKLIKTPKIKCKLWQ